MQEALIRHRKHIGLKTKAEGIRLTRERSTSPRCCQSI